MKVFFIYGVRIYGFREQGNGHKTSGLLLLPVGFFYDIILLLIIEEFYTMHPITLTSSYGILVEDVFHSLMLWDRFI